MYTVVVDLAQKELEKYGMTGWWPSFVTDAGSNVRRAIRGELAAHEVGEQPRGGLADWSRCACHMLHNVVTHGLTNLRHRASHTEGSQKLCSAIDR